MTEPKTVVVTPELHDYLMAHSGPLDDVARDLVEKTQGRLGDAARMQIAPEQGLFLTMLTRLIGARSAIELGTFTGFSALCIARGLAPGGRLICCDVSDEWTSIGRGYWARAGVADRIELRLGPALDTVRSLPPDPTIDLAFIDADKGNYVNYWEELVPRMRPGGLVLGDNVLWSGEVADPDVDDDNTVAIRAFNDRVAADERVEAVILPIADGLTIAMVR
ncbi:MAG: O-methyltransferase [Acidimicrobiales bacterium]